MAPTSTPGSPWPPSRRAPTASGSGPWSHRCHAAARGSSRARQSASTACRAAASSSVSVSAPTTPGSSAPSASRATTARAPSSSTRDWRSSRSCGRGSRSTIPAAIFTSTACGSSPGHSSNPASPSGAAPTGPTDAPLRRAARYDGVVPIGDLPPEAVTELLTEVGRHRTTEEPFDVAIPSWTATTAPARIRSRRRNMVAGGIPTRHTPRDGPDGHRTRPYTGVEQARAG